MDACNINNVIKLLQAMKKDLPEHSYCRRRGGRQSNAAHSWQSSLLFMVETALVVWKRVSKCCLNGGREEHDEVCLCYLLLLHCDTSVALSVGPKRRLLLDMQGAANVGGCYFRKWGKDRRVPSIVAWLVLKSAFL